MAPRSRLVADRVHVSDRNCAGCRPCAAVLKRSERQAWLEPIWRADGKDARIVLSYKVAGPRRMRRWRNCPSLLQIEVGIRDARGRAVKASARATAEAAVREPDLPDPIQRAAKGRSARSPVGARVSATDCLAKSRQGP